MTKILHLQNIAAVSNGVTRHISLIAKSTNNNTHFLAVSDFQFDDYDKLSNYFADILILSHNRSYMQDFFLLLKYCKSKNISIIHSHHRYFNFLALLISKLLHLKTVTTVHSRVYGRKTFSYNSEKIIVVSNAIKFHLTKYFRVSPQKIEVIYNFIDPDFMKISYGREKIRSELELSNDDILIGYYGRLEINEKGLGLLIEAFKILNCRYNNIKLFLMGDGLDRDYLIEQIKVSKIKSIILEGRNNVFDYSQAIDIFVLPSRIDPFPYVMLETAYLKIPFIGSNVDGIPEYVTNGFNGLLFEKNNVNQLSEQIEKLMIDKNLREYLMKNNYDKVTSSFIKGNFIKRYNIMYSSL